MVEVKLRLYLFSWICITTPVFPKMKGYVKTPNPRIFSWYLKNKPINSQNGSATNLCYAMYNKFQLDRQTVDLTDRRHDPNTILFSFIIIKPHLFMGNYVLKNNHVHIKVSSLITFEIPESNVPITLSAFPRRIAMNFLNPDIFWRRNPKI